MEALRARFADMLGTLGEHKLEVLNEAGGKRIVLLEILVAVGPGTGRIEDQRGDVAEASLEESRYYLILAQLSQL